MSQTWKIGGKTLNHSQILEMRAQNLNPRDDFELKQITKPKNKKVVAEKHEVVITPEAMAEYPELAEQGVKVGDAMPIVTETAEEKVESTTLPSHSELRELAKAKGMEVSNTTKKAELIAFLEANK